MACVGSVKIKDTVKQTIKLLPRQSRNYEYESSHDMFG